MQILATVLVIAIMTFGVVWIIVGPVTPKEYTSHEPIIIKNDQDFIDYDFPGLGNETDPFIIEGYYINSSLDAIFITQTTKYFVIRNCKLEAEREGIYITFVAQKTVKIENNIFVSNGILISDSYYVELQNNLFTESAESGIHLINSNHAIIRNNTIFNGGTFGIQVIGYYCLIEDNKIYSDNIIEINAGISYQGTGTIIRNNTIEKQYWGLYLPTGNSNLITENHIEGCREGILAQSLHLSNITNNFLLNNTLNGIRFHGGASNDIYLNHFEKNNIGIEICQSFFNVIANNTLLLNNIGLEIKDFPGTISYIPSKNNTVKYNLFVNNTLYGVKNSILSQYSKIYLNSFYFNNALGTSQAYDNGVYSEWHYFSTWGNFWNEWSLGDYMIDGNSNSTDSYPLSFPPV